MSSFRIDCYHVGELATNAYIVSDPKTGDAICIDPGDEGGYLSEIIMRGTYTLRGILFTHGHYDHVLGAWEIQHNFPVPTLMHVDDISLLKTASSSAHHFMSDTSLVLIPDITQTMTKDGSEMFGSISISWIETPGHTPGSVTYLIGSDVFSGDMVFSDRTFGDTSHRYSDPKKFLVSLNKLAMLPETYLIHPGHGDVFFVRDMHATSSNRVEGIS